MCLIILAHNCLSHYPLIIAANRDEFHARPARQAEFWEERPELLAGKDLQAGGTWLGLTRTGRFAALTNYRDLRRPRILGPSRGALVLNALDSAPDLSRTNRYEGFNLIHGTVGALRYHSNVTKADEDLSAGVHGISNHLLDTPWPKVVNARRRFLDALGNDALGSGEGMPDVEPFFELLRDHAVTPDEMLPDTGLDLDRERQVSSIFIAGDQYGTRCSTVVLVRRDGLVYFEERTHHPKDLQARKFEMNLPAV